jgi:peptidoglycan/LPS O-acetylase OafA/YrhL
LHVIQRSSHTQIALARFEGLDLVRFVAAILIVLYHYTFHGPGAFGLTWVSLPGITPVTRYFYLGVPLFFVISGFVIARSATGRTVPDFALARIARIYPTFLVCMTITFLSVVLFGKPQIGVSIGQWFANWFIAAPLLKSAYVDSVYWSIVYEITFYGLVAGLMGLGLFRRRLHESIALWLLISCANELFVGSEGLRRILITNYSSFFASGMLIYMMLTTRREIKTVALLACAVALGAFQADTNSDWLRAHGVALSHSVVIVLAIAVPAFVAMFAIMPRVSAGSHIVLALGGLTYPLYLLHQTIGYEVFNHLAWRAHPVLLVAGTLLAMIALSWTFYEAVDKPLHEASRIRLRQLSAALLPRVGIAG